MAGRHDKPPSPYLFLANSLSARHHATVSIIIVIGRTTRPGWNRAVGDTFLSGTA